MGRATMAATVAVNLAIALCTLLLAAPTESQQVTGTPGSPSATTTIDGKQLPAAAPKIRRCDQG